MWFYWPIVRDVCYMCADITKIVKNTASLLLLFIIFTIVAIRGIDIESLYNIQKEKLTN